MKQFHEADHGHSDDDHEDDDVGGDDTIHGVPAMPLPSPSSSKITSSRTSGRHPTSTSAALPRGTAVSTLSSTLLASTPDFAQSEATTRKTEVPPQKSTMVSSHKRTNGGVIAGLAIVALLFVSVASSGIFYGIKRGKHARRYRPRSDSWIRSVNAEKGMMDDDGNPTTKSLSFNEMLLSSAPSWGERSVQDTEQMTQVESVDQLAHVESTATDPRLSLISTSTTYTRKKSSKLRGSFMSSESSISDTTDLFYRAPVSRSIPSEEDDLVRDEGLRISLPNSLDMGSFGAVARKPLDGLSNETGTSTRTHSSGSVRTLYDSSANAGDDDRNCKLGLVEQEQRKGEDDEIHTTNNDLKEEVTPEISDTQDDLVGVALCKSL